MMVSQGGTGSGISGPSVAELYKTLFGIKGQQVELAKAVPPGGHPTAVLPTVRPDGTIVTPESRRPAADRVPAAGEPTLRAPDVRAHRRDEGAD